MLLQEVCLRLGVQLIAVDRPGYGKSDNITVCRLGRWPLIIDELAEYLGFAQFYVFAVSGGAPYALICASELPERVLGTGICCGLAEVARPELLDEMPGFARLAFHLARSHPLALRYSYGSIIEASARLAPRLAIGILAYMLGEPDRSVLGQPDIKTIFAANLQEAFHQGPIGALADMCSALEPWSFELSGIRSLWLWHGTQDNIVPSQHSLWLARNIPNAVLQQIKGEGHFSLPLRYIELVIKSVIPALSTND
jgi:pimeloyl-ACP methyl ester carboxylesterase